ncbi:MAG: hypothetical protein OEZ68_21615 [Gammaproteobacteria bacterium]|nr:hypothetical protein [Gammaproteobacteria bacterium]MDH5803398.1 hypothetical protein [Gammaproteobacteria bacterium]
MNEPLVAIGKIKNLLKECGNEIDAANFAAVKTIILELTSVENDRYGQYTWEKLTNLNWHINAMFGADIDNGRSYSDHISWALGEISSLESKLCFGKE